MTNSATATAGTVAAELMRLRAMLDMLDPLDSSAQGLERQHQITTMQAQLAALSAQNVAETQALRVEEDTARGVPQARRGAGLASEVGLASRQSPARGQQQLKTATILTKDMPNTFGSLAVGQLTEEHARVVATEVGWLTPELRAEVDTRLIDQMHGLGPRKLATLVRGHAQQLDQPGAVARNERAQSERRVSVRPAPGGMAYATALLPMPQAVSLLATLTRDANSLIGTGDTADAAGRPRTRAQLMADLLVERATGQTTAAGVPAEVQLVMSDTTLFSNDESPAWITGHGPLPAGIAKHWLASSAAKLFLRRTYARPETGQVVGMDSRQRRFPDGLRRLIAAREGGICRTPYCDALIQETDHATPHRTGGHTTWTNGSGLCAGCNKTKELPGWRHDATPDGLTVTTPTGQQYARPTGPLIPNMKPPDRQQPPDEHEPQGDENPPDKPPGEKPPGHRKTCNYTRAPRTDTITMRIAA